MVSINNKKTTDETYQYLQQGMNFLGQFGQSAGVSYDKIAWFQQGISSGYNIYSGISNNNSDQTVNGVQNIANLLVSIIEGVGNKAKSDVKESKKAIKDGEKKVEEAKVETEKKVDEILKEIEDNSNKIKQITDELKKENEEKSKEFQEQLEDRKKEVEENIAILNNENSTQEEKEAALEDIQCCSDAIKEILGQADEFSKSIENKTTEVEELQANIETKSNEANEVIAEQLNNIKALENETAKEAIKNSSFVVKGGIEEATGAELQAAAVAVEAGTLGTGTAVAADLEKASIDNFEAGTTHISGSAKNLTTLGNALGSIGGDFASVSGCMNKVGSALNDAVSIIGSYQSESLGMMVSIGTWTTTTTKSQEELQEAIDAYTSEDPDNSDKQALLDFKFNDGPIDDVTSVTTDEFTFNFNLPENIA